MTDAVIVSTARTAIGTAYTGALNNTQGAEMGGHAIKHAVERAITAGTASQLADGASACVGIHGAVSIGTGFNNRYSGTTPTRMPRPPETDSGGGSQRMRIELGRVAWSN